MRSSFYARTQAEELKCPDLELNVLDEHRGRDRPGQRRGEAGGRLAEAEKQRRAVMNTIEKESFDQTGLRSDVVTLYQGGLYHLYRYKKYTDVRLVFAPEQDIAFFGGDPDNFEYPRYDLDICFFRVYENGRPVKPQHYLRWNPAGLKEDDLVFVAGNPGQTDRLNTVQHLEFLRDCILPASLNMLAAARSAAGGVQRAERGERPAGQGPVADVQNSRKARLGGLAGLQDPAVMGRKRAEEKALLAAAARRAPLATACDTAVKTVNKSLEAWALIRTDYDLLERGQAFYSDLFVIARHAGPAGGGNRQAECRAAARIPRVEPRIAQAGAILAGADLRRPGNRAAGRLAEHVHGTQGRRRPSGRRKVMAGKSPQQRAAELVGGTRLADVAVRRKLAKGGHGGHRGLGRPDDPLGPPGRQAGPQGPHVLRAAGRGTAAVGLWQVGRARFALFGTETYPDATFTLRLAFGLVKGYSEAGQQEPAWTTIGGAYRHAEEHGRRSRSPCRKAGWTAKDRLNLDTPMNFVCTADIIGGNSGSPVVNRQGELVGIIFDGNLPSLVWDYVFSETDGRAIAVHGSAILEALRKIYGAGRLADEMAGKP